MRARGALWRAGDFGVVVLGTRRLDPVTLAGTGVAVWDALAHRCAGTELVDAAGGAVRGRPARVAGDVAPVLDGLVADGVLEVVRDRDDAARRRGDDARRRSARRSSSPAATRGTTLWADARDERPWSRRSPRRCTRAACTAPPSSAPRSSHAHEEAMRACVRLERVALEVTADLAAAGIETRLLKGAATARLDYDDPSWRSFGDVDLLVRSDDYDAAVGRCCAAAAPGADRPSPAPASTGGSARACA